MLAYFMRQHRDWLPCRPFMGADFFRWIPFGRHGGRPYVFHRRPFRQWSS